MSEAAQQAPLPPPPKPIPQSLKRVLIIKLGALGDFVQQLASARMIRQYHVGARITLLTTEPFEKFAQACPYYDVIDPEGRPREPQDVAKLIARIRGAKYEAIYDLQTSGRTANYFHLLKPWPPRWCGVAQGCSHPHLNPERGRMHSLDRLADQLEVAGIGPPGGWRVAGAPLPDVTWIRTALRDPPRLQPAYFGITKPYILMIPGASEHRPQKRWPAERYAALASDIAARGLTPVIIGAGAEREAGQAIADAEPRVKNLVSRTDLFQVAALAQRASGAVGNDTGPMHIAAAAGAPCVVLFSADSNPEKVAPRGRGGVLVLRAEDLSQMPVDQVAQALGNVGALAGAPT